MYLLEARKPDKGLLSLSSKAGGNKGKTQWLNATYTTFFEHGINTWTATTIGFLEEKAMEATFKYILFLKRGCKWGGVS